MKAVKIDEFDRRGVNYAVLRGYGDVDILVDEKDKDKVRDIDYVMVPAHVHYNKESWKGITFVPKSALRSKIKSRSGEYFTVRNWYKLRMRILRFPMKVLRWIRGWQF